MAPTLDKSLTLPFELWFEDFAPDYPTIRVSNEFASATIALHGAQVIDYIPKGHEPVIFTSKEAVFREGKAIRGGVPVCWPWFGAHPEDASQPAHGFARNRFWQLTSTRSSDTGTELTLTLDTESIDALPSKVALTLTISVGAELTLELTTTNLGQNAIEIGGALHTYLTVGDIAQASIQGLESHEYLDTVASMRETQNSEITFAAETDAIYLNATQPVTLHDPVLKRSIQVAKKGSRTTVVWNPWIDKATALSDLLDDEYHEFVCIEAANALDDTHSIGQDESHTLATTITATSYA
ncbi:D-hexose-6-phosphate mutarotase [Rubritalea tangerina]|uniref:Putative glucose-6-phosphate 1-epimerase n=2 Tax=Rubritalea tangerina TaxID=430798 RepID=A0ABW4ZET5_9BACT